MIFHRIMDQCLNLAELVVLMHDEWYYIVEALDACCESCQ